MVAINLSITLSSGKAFTMTMDELDELRYIIGVNFNTEDELDDELEINEQEMLDALLQFFQPPTLKQTPHSHANYKNENRQRPKIQNANQQRPAH